MEHRRVKIIICVTIAVWSILLLKDSQTFESSGTYSKWIAPPSMESFANYEEMQKYISEKEFRSSKTLANPLDDSYINAYNFHHESQDRIVVKRNVKSTQSPQIFKFEVEDAREPDDATKHLIRLHRGRELHLEKTIEKAKNSTISKRTKRSAPKTKPMLIRFEVSDAKEPDEATKELIRQSRARELRMATEKKVASSIHSPQMGTKKVTHKRKRTRRSAEMTQPQFIRFELEDAKVPDNDIKGLIQEMSARKMRSDSINQLLYHQSNETEDLDDSSVEESKRLFFYQAVPMKSKRVANTVPNEVKKIIDLMLKGSKAQAYSKYFSANQDAKSTTKSIGNTRPVYGSELTSIPSAPGSENLVTIYPEQAFVQKLLPLPVSVHTFPLNILSPPPQAQPSETAPHQIIIPDVTSNQHYYHSVVPTVSNAGVYQQPGTYLKVIPTMNQVFHEVPTSSAEQQQHQPELSLNSVDNIDISKRYPFAKITPLEPSYGYDRYLNFYPNMGSQQTILPNDNRITGSFNDGLQIEQKQTSVSKNNINEEQYQIPLKNMQEFQELSALIGKSPTDQIHGLAYLLAKEMQRNKRLKAQRPQDNTSPILFHPENNLEAASIVPILQESKESEAQRHQPIEPSPKDYTAIVEHDSYMPHATQVNTETTVVVPPQPPQQHSTTLSAAKTLGLSPNYKGIDQIDLPPSHHPNVEDGNGLQYASKYAFGYRVRDFYSGNDFGHKQNRELDGVTRGQYHILLPDGRVQNVIYHADDTGFHADVTFETGHH